MNLDKFKTIDLLAEIIRREKIRDAPIKTSRSSGHKEVIVRIGNDEIANIIIHDDALVELNKMTGK